MREKLKKYLSKKEYIVFIVALIITLASLSYAFFLSSDMFNNNIAITDCFKLTFNDSNDIHLDKTYPLSESEGSNLTPYQFTIKNVCNLTADYQVNIETLNTSTLDTEYLRIKLDNNESSILKRYELNTNNVNNNVLEGRNITTGTLRENEERTYSLRMWIDENAPVEQSSNKEYYGKVTVNASPNKEVNDVELAYIIDGVQQDAPPAKTDGYIIKSVTCENAEGIWSNRNWNLTLNNITGKAFCNLEFEEANYNNIPKWLSTANINKNYTTISEVLNDTDTLSTLINNNDSCEYLMNSTEWVSDIVSNENAMTYIGNNDYCGDLLYLDDNWDDDIADSTYFDKVLNVTVPKMTSNTTPEGEVTAIHTYSSAYPAYGAFDGDDTKLHWYSANATFPQWLQYHFTKKVVVRAFDILSYPSGYSIKDFKIQGSNDNFVNDINDLGSFSFTTSNRNYGMKQSLSNTKEYEYYRVFATSFFGEGAGHTIIMRLQFYGREAN